MAMRRQVSSREKGVPPRWRTTSGSPITFAWASRSLSQKALRRSRSVSTIGTKRAGLLLAEGQAAEALVEARHLAAAVDHAVVAAGPGRMDLGIDVELEGVARLAPGGAGLEHGAVGHLHLDHVVIGMGVGLHLGFPEISAGSDQPRKGPRPIAGRGGIDKPRAARLAGCCLRCRARKSR